VNYLVPVHNEALNISSMIRRILWIDTAAQICIVNSASKDDSVNLAKGYPVHIISAPKGYTQALAIGYQFAVQQKWTHLIQLDADGQHDPVYANVLYRALSNVDWAIGSRHNTGSFGTSIMRAMAYFSRKKYLPADLHDPSSGYWALNERMIHIFAERFPVEFTEIPLRLSLLISGIRIQEICVPMLSRSEGVSMNAGINGVIHGFKMLFACRKIQRKSR